MKAFIIYLKYLLKSYNEIQKKKIIQKNKKLTGISITTCAIWDPMKEDEHLYLKLLI